jgi:hypothetical protein
MHLPVLPAAMFALAAFTLPVPPAEAPASPEGPAAMVGAALYMTEAPVPRWGEAPRMGDLPVEAVGRIRDVELSPEGAPVALTVAVGGLWGLGAQEVTVSAERLRMLPTDAGGTALVLDLSAAGAAPPSDAAL